MPSLLPEGINRVLVTGGAGFIGGALVRRLLRDSSATVFNLDKIGYASDLTGIERLGPEAGQRHQLLRVDLTDADATAAAVLQADPDLVMHLAAESHVDRSIDGPAAFIESNVSGTFNLLQAVRAHWEHGCCATPAPRCSTSTRSVTPAISPELNAWAPRRASATSCCGDRRERR